MNRTIPFLAALLVLSACNPEQGAAPEPTFIPDRTLVLGAPAAPGADKLIGNSEAAKAARMETLSRAGTLTLGFARAHAQGLPLSEREALAAEALRQADETDALTAWFVRQIIAGHMLQDLLAEPDARPERLAPYVRVLVDGQSPNAHLVAAGLDRLRGVWTAEEISASASRAHESAETWAARHAPAALRAGDALTNRSDEVQAIKDGLVHLAALR